MWALTGFSLSVGYHRLFSHRAFKTFLPIRILFTVFGCMAARSSMITWTATHRRHHQMADHDGDVHSPNLHGRKGLGRVKGWWYSHFTWMLNHEYPNVVHYVPDLLSDKVVVRVDRQYYLWIFLGLVAPAIVGGGVSGTLYGALSGFLWGGLARMAFVAQQVSALNSFNHMFGTRMFPMPDNYSHNNVLFGLITFGEGWHNNHHALPSSATFGFRWYQLDPGYFLIRMLEVVGLAWDVRRYEPRRIETVRQRLVAADLELRRQHAATAGTGTLGAARAE
jgi:stearoyl-CoA desaturase (delta-9 desaturase)